MLPNKLLNNTLISTWGSFVWQVVQRVKARAAKMGAQRFLAAFWKKRTVDAIHKVKTKSS